MPLEGVNILELETPEKGKPKIDFFNFTYTI